MSETVLKVRGQRSSCSQAKCNFRQRNSQQPSVRCSSGVARPLSSDRQHILYYVIRRPALMELFLLVAFHCIS